MRFYTWKDIERHCLKNFSKWQNIIASIDMYPDEMIVYTPEGGSEERALEALCEIFPRNIDREDCSIKLNRKAEPIKITLETELELFEKKPMPLFRQVVYNKSAYPAKEPEALPCPVIAFHSYKGGVGRTLSLLAFAQAWTNVCTANGSERILIIDSDIEAPGLSWIQEERDENAFSYLDLLTLIQDEENVDDIVETAAEKIGSLFIPIETAEKRVQHIFLPTFRYYEQMFDLYASPDSVIKGKNREYILAEILAKVAVRLGVSLVLVDLRAGISEYSAPLLLDPRVKKYFVTSTSLQSVVGTCKMLEYVAKGLTISEDSNLPTILLSMVPNTLGSEEKNTIIGRITGCFEVNEDNAQLLDNLIVELPFASELVHLTRLKQILGALKGRDMYTNIETIVSQYYVEPKIEENEEKYTEGQRVAILKRINAFAHNQITAEANGAVELLLTQPIKNLCSKFGSHLPSTVVRGAKGSGKTFLYRQLLSKYAWSSFCESVDGKSRKERQGYFLPVFAPKNANELNDLLGNNIDLLNLNLSFASISKTVYMENAQRLDKQSDLATDWVAFWEQLLSSSVSGEIKTFDQLNHELEKENHKIVYLIDGLEEILRNVSQSRSQQKAIQVLCQDVINILSVKYDNIGIIVFLRNDMAQNAITVNLEQFKQAYSYAELKWTSEEAQRLAVWIISQALPGEFYDSGTPIEEASTEIIERHLKKLWGTKLGKDSSNEAYSSRWILAALSDFNRQLQARDIIRFLEYAAKPSTKKASYDDRILMPSEIRAAVPSCSRDKIVDIKTEYESLRTILERLDNLPQEKKVLPLNPEYTELTAEEEKMMMQEGYLTRDGDRLYLPEIIRHALGFRYEKGARPKVLSLLL